MARSRTVVVAGAGIGGLTLALALARKGFRAVVLEQADHLEDTGAGIQLSPNASRILLELGLDKRLVATATALDAIRIRQGRTGRDIVRMPLGAQAQARYGAPYWVIHRGDLQSILLEAIEASPDITLRLGSTFEDFATHAHGVTVQARCKSDVIHEHGIALIGADGLWSGMRAKIGPRTSPQFAQRTAWRAVVPADRIAPEFREPATSLWLGRDAHLVHYSIRAGSAINIVAIVHDQWEKAGWSAEAPRNELMTKFSHWAPAARALLDVPETWLKWALYDCAPFRTWGKAQVTLLGDAAHPALPFLAQAGAMAIEDAAVLAHCLATVSEPAAALRTYENMRRTRTAQVQRAARRNGTLYHLGGPAAFARNLGLAMAGGEQLLKHYDWLYDWRHPQSLS